MNKQSIIASSMGNSIEWYDFALFIYLGPVMAQLFFPAHNPAVSTLSWLCVFALGFICRPLGGILLGHFGDRVGRSHVLRYSIGLIALPTLLISFLPTYSQIGIIAPIVLVLLRLIQGICIGGEYAGIMIYLAEMSPRKHRALITSFAATGANLGLLIGISLAYCLQHYLNDLAFHQYGWRIAFFVGGVLGFIILILRARILETASFSELIEKNLLVKIPFMTCLKKDFYLIFKIIGLISFGGVLFYTTFTYINYYLLEYTHLSLKHITLLQTVMIALMLFLVPFFGWLCDKLGQKAMYIIFCSISILIINTIFHTIQQHNYGDIVVALVILTILSSMEQATTLIAVIEMVPKPTRYTTIALAYNLGFILFGGITPLIMSFLIKILATIYAPSFYLMVTALLTLLIAILFVKKTPLHQQIL